MLKLKFYMPLLGVEQAKLAMAIGISPPALSLIANHNIWPKRVKPIVLQTKIREHLEAAGATEDQIRTAFEKRAVVRCSEHGSDANPLDDEEDAPMLLRKQTLMPDTRKHFKLPGDPFGEVNDASEVYVNEHTRFVRATLLDCAKRGGFIALVGESGSGKTTLKRDLKERINTQNLPIRVIEPYVLAMEQNDIKGRTLKSAQIADAIFAIVAPHETPRQSVDARFRQLERVLSDSVQAGQHHTVIIEEAHSLPTATLKHLKRFLELESGFKRLLSIILIGQTELAIRLDERNAALREVVQRCEVITLPPLGTHLEDYLAFRLGRYQLPVKAIIDNEGLQALTERLQPRVPRGHHQQSLLYPLAVHNLLIAAMNLAADSGAPVVNADVIQEV
ncbi:MAG: transposase [Alcaligenaceae bacterium]|nr:transposase [Alcaligenaceae bacterium]